MPINTFEGYHYDKTTGANYYHGIDVGKGGYVYSVPGMYEDVWAFDVGSMHPNSFIQLGYLGEYTKRYKELLDFRLAVKHKDYEAAKKMLDGKAEEYLNDDKSAKQLASAAKTILNSAYGVSYAQFPTPIRHPMNENNIVALRGALFMKTLQDELEQKENMLVIGIKTDCIKVAHPTEKQKQFILDFGKKYGYTFEVEHVFEKFCLKDKANYVGKCAAEDPDCPGEWLAVGDFFSEPYLFKTLFSHEPIEFKDLCETKSVKTQMYLDMNESLPCCVQDEAMLEKLAKKGITDGPEVEALKKHIEEGHDYHFVGRVGSFCPIKSGCGGGLLVKLNDRTGKYDAVTGAKGYRWLEAEGVKLLHKDADVDLSYHRKLVDKARESLQEQADKCGKDLNWFLDDSTPDYPEDEILPWCAPKDCATCDGYDVCHDYMHKVEKERL